MFRSIKDLKFLLISSTSILTITGLLWLFFEHFVVEETDFGPSHHPLQKWWLIIHGLMAVVFVFVFGMTYVIHVQRTIKNNERLVSGWANLIFWSLIIISGYLLLYISGDKMREYTSLFHWGLGIGSMVMLLFHSRSKIR